MNIIDLFPPCMDPRCDRPDRERRSDGTHGHVLPLQKALLESSDKYVAMIGGWGSGKTLPMCIMGHLLSVSIPGNMGIMLRRSFPKLHDATERIYLEVLDRSGEDCRFYEMRDGWPHRIVYPNGSEVSFRETKDLGRFLGPEYGWFGLDEAQEEPEKTFKDLMGRLRLPRAGRYLKGMIATNPPHRLHWLAKRFPKDGAWKTTEIVHGKEVSTSWRMIRSSTLDNPFLDPEYVAGIMSTHTPDEIKRIIHGHYGSAYDGTPVFPEFDFTRNVTDPPTRLMPLYRVWDFGFHHPACTWHQMFNCAKGKLHWVILHEYGGTDILAESFAKLVLAETMLRFQEVPLPLVVDGGDTAGAQVGDHGPGPIIRLARPNNQGGFDLKFAHRKFPDIDPGLDLMRSCLKTRCQCGYPLLTISRRCTSVIEGLAGGYHYPPEKMGKEKARKPVKDGYYDNFIDTVRYAGELFYRARSKGEQFLDTIGGETIITHDWGWMDGMR